MIRGETFGRNFAILEQKFGELHKKELGEQCQLSKYGYPDLGNNLYSDELSYGDWVKINNGQRCHENMVTLNPVFFTTTFVSALSFPRFTLGSSLLYLVLRVMYTRAYLSSRGYNKATALEEIIKLHLIVLVTAALLSSCKVMRLGPTLRNILSRGKK